MTTPDPPMYHWGRGRKLVGGLQGEARLHLQALAALSGCLLVLTYVLVPAILT